MARFRTTVRWVAAPAPARAGRRRRPVPGQLAAQAAGRLPGPRRRADPGRGGGPQAAGDEGHAGPARLRRLLLHRPGGQPGLAGHLHPRGRGAADQRAVGRRGRGPDRLRLPRRPGGSGGRRPSAPRCRRSGLKVRPQVRRRAGARRRPPTSPRSPALRSARSSSAPSRSATTRPPRCWPATSAWPSGRRARSRRARRRCSTCCDGSAYPSPATGCTTAAGSPAATGSTADTLPACSRLAESAGPPGAAAGAHRAAGRRLHRLAAVPLRQGPGRRPAGGSGPRPARSPGCTAWPGWPTT